MYNRPTVNSFARSYKERFNSIEKIGANVTSQSDNETNPIAEKKKSLPWVAILTACIPIVVFAIWAINLQKPFDDEMAKGQKFEKLGSFARALDCYKKAQAFVPQKPVLLYPTSVQKAFTELKDGSLFWQKDPQAELTALLSQGRILKYLGLYKDCDMTYKSSRDIRNALYEESSYPYLNCEYEYLDLDQLKGAFPLLSYEALERDVAKLTEPDEKMLLEAKVHDAIAQIHLSMKQLTEARKHLDKATTLYSKAALNDSALLKQAHHLLLEAAWLRRTQRPIEEVKQKIAECKEKQLKLLSPSHQDNALTEIAFADMLMEPNENTQGEIRDTAEAIQILTTLIQPATPPSIKMQAIHRLIECKLNLGKIAEAKNFVLAGKELLKQNEAEISVQTQASFYLAQGHYFRAKKCKDEEKNSYQKVLELAGENSILEATKRQALLDTGFLSCEEKELKTAESILKRVRQIDEEKYSDADKLEETIESTGRRIAEESNKPLPKPSTIEVSDDSQGVNIQVRNTASTTIGIVLNQVKEQVLGLDEEITFTKVPIDPAIPPVLKVQVANTTLSSVQLPPITKKTTKLDWNGSQLKMVID